MPLRGLREFVSRRVRPTAGGDVAERLGYNTGNQDLWEERARVAVDLWARNDGRWREGRSPLRVTDLGAGNERLRRLLSERLPYRVEYRPYDLHPQYSTTEVLDARMGLPEETADLTFALGLLEYIPIANPIVDRLGQHSEFAAISYVGLSSETISLDQRRAHGWVRHQTTDELLEQFRAAGFEVLGAREVDGGLTGVRLLAHS